VTALPTGKLPAALLRELLGALPSLPPEVRLGPRVGEDACAIAVPAGALVVATDPITLTGAGVGAHAVWVNANDVAVMGVRPRWFLATALFPVGATEAEVRELFASLSGALERLGAVLVGGHTEVTPAVRQLVVVGQMLGLREDGRFIPTGGARAGDAIVQVGPAPIEAAAILAADPRAADVPEPLRRRAERALGDPGIVVVEPALLAAQLGASALHDPTEGGLSAGLHELAEASGVRIDVREDDVLWFEPGRALCLRLALDPWGAIASGCLLAAFPEGRAAPALDALSREGCDARVIGRAAVGTGVFAGGRPLPRYDRDELSRLSDPVPTRR
jgi:hydrogenase maturation factor